MITFTIAQIADTLAKIAIKNRLQIGMIFSVIKRMGSQVYSSHFNNSLELVFSSLEDFEIWIKESYTQ